MAGFKTSLFGFSKKSVLAFTKELSDTYSENIKQKDKEINTLKNEIKELKQKNKEIDALKAEIAELEKKLKETENGTDE